MKETFYTEQEFKQTKDRLLNALTMGHSVQKEPHGYLLVDTFRTARETLVDRFLQMEHGDVISVFADDFLKDHPHADELCARYGAEAASHAQAFSEKMALALIEELEDARYNLVIGSTLMDSSSPFEPVTLRNRLMDCHYRDSLNVLFVRPEVSYLFLLRQAAMKHADGRVSQKISMEQHYDDIQKMLDSLQMIDALHFFPDLRLFTIDGFCVYQALQTSCLSTAVMKEEFARKLDPDEAAALWNDYADAVESSDEMEKILAWFPQAFRQKVAEEAHAYFEKHKLDLVQKEVEIPYWQDVFVRKHDIDLSEVLKDALVDLWKKTGGHM